MFLVSSPSAIFFLRKTIKFKFIERFIESGTLVSLGTGSYVIPRLLPSSSWRRLVDGLFQSKLVYYNLPK
ncbi:hypothetical protein LEP1GSC016_3731 [Leptospira borgpetersenii serovar Hardjo-bovis str. Sponselee]|uniref:Uncharacterized protein n=1 Tax=Leptospira borgpetersenii serovar Hardjo-bovis str. Sponselee TaxID=1303729 RepID=M6BWB3_LEPBO|nr:hypothetical protein LEP1GSC016_3731 [Leptospira borgpetersenii serovar Hardjo-bovis str. Sponselee]